MIYTGMVVDRKITTHKTYSSIRERSYMPTTDINMEAFYTSS